MIQEEFFDKTFTDESLVRKSAKKYTSTANNDLKTIISVLNRIDPVPISIPDNVSKGERKAMEELKMLTKQTIEIKKADKTDVLVIMDKEQYRDNLVMGEHLNTQTYKKVEIDANKKVFSKLKKLIAEHNTCLTKKERQFVLDEEWVDAHFYVLPKINKCPEIVDTIKAKNQEYVEMKMPETLKSRPICGGPKAVTQGASKLLDRILSPLVPHMRSYVKDEWSFVRQFPKHIDGKYKLVSCDIVSLYPSIPTDLGIEALDYWIDRLREYIPTRFTKEFILSLAEFVLTNNNCEFNGEMYHQEIGTSMGSIFAPPYSCLTIGFLEETKLYPTLSQHFDERICKLILEWFYRFMDDEINLPPFEVDTKLFLNIQNSLHPSIRVESIETRINSMKARKLVFLSMVIYLTEKGYIWTDVSYKETSNLVIYITAVIIHILSKEIFPTVLQNK